MSSWWQLSVCPECRIYKEKFHREAIQGDDFAPFGRVDGKDNFANVWRSCPYLIFATAYHICRKRVDASQFRIVVKFYFNLLKCSMSERRSRSSQDDRQLLTLIDPPSCFRSQSDVVMSFSNVGDNLTYAGERFFYCGPVLLCIEAVQRKFNRSLLFETKFLHAECPYRLRTFNLATMSNLL